MLGAGVFVTVSLVRHYVPGRGKERPLAYVDLSPSIARVTFTRPVISVIRKPEKLRNILREQMPSAPEPPSIDYRTRQAVLVATGARSSTGYALRISRVVEDRKRILVLVRELTPAAGAPTVARFVYPSLLITLPKGDKKINVHFENR